jgi:hypothetical protein
MKEAGAGARHAARQAGQDQQRLPAGVQAAPSATAFGSADAQQLGKACLIVRCEGGRSRQAWWPETDTSSTRQAISTGMPRRRQAATGSVFSPLAKPGPRPRSIRSCRRQA